MVTGATTADAVIVLIDGRKGVLEQTRRHLAVDRAAARAARDRRGQQDRPARLLARMPSPRVAAQVEAVTAELGIDDVHVLPVSALEGDNIVDRSERTPWYDGPALLELLEALPAAGRARVRRSTPFRLPVQLVLRPQGGLRPSSPPTRTRPSAARLPRRRRTHLVGHRARGRPRRRSSPPASDDRHGHRGRRASRSTEAAAPQSVSLQLADDVDAARGAVDRRGRTRCRRAAARSTPSCSSSTPGRSSPARACSSSTAPRRCRRSSRRSSRATTSTPSPTSRPTPSRRTTSAARALRLAADLPLEPYSASRHGRLVPGHPSVRRRDTRRRHRARLTCRAHPPPPALPTEGGEP